MLPNVPVRSLHHVSDLLPRRGGDGLQSGHHVQSLRLLYQLLSDHIVGLSAVRGALHDVSAGVLLFLRPGGELRAVRLRRLRGCLWFMWFMWFMWIVRGRMRHMRDDRSAVGGLSLVRSRNDRRCSQSDIFHLRFDWNGAASADAHAGAARYITRRFHPGDAEQISCGCAGAGHEHAQPGPAGGAEGRSPGPADRSLDICSDRRAGAGAVVEQLGQSHGRPARLSGRLLPVDCFAAEGRSRVPGQAGQQRLAGFALSSQERDCRGAAAGGLLWSLQETSGPLLPGGRGGPPAFLGLSSAQFWAEPLANRALLG